MKNQALSESHPRLWGYHALVEIHVIIKIQIKLHIQPENSVDGQTVLYVEWHQEN